MKSEHRAERPDRPVRVCMLITDLNVGGAEKALVHLATGLDRTRWEVSVINLGGEEPLAQVLRSQGFEVRCLNVAKRKPVQAIGRLVRALKDLRPDLLQCFMFHANVAGRLAAKLAGVRWVMGGLRVAEHQKTWHLVVDRLTNWLSCGSVCVSDGVKRFSQEYGGLSERRLFVIPNGVNPKIYDDVEPLEHKELGLKSRDQVALFIGRLDAQKGLPYLMDAVEIVASKKPDWHLVMIGREGSESDWFRSRVAESPILKKHVHWLGFRSDVPRFLKSANVLVLPSLWEGMPNVVLEAMACSLAVVGTAVEGTSELVVPGRTGWLVPPESGAALAEALLESANDPALTKQYGIAGRNRVELYYSTQQTVNSYDELWTQVLGYRN